MYKHQKTNTRAHVWKCTQYAHTQTHTYAHMCGNARKYTRTHKHTRMHRLRHD